MMKTSQLTTTVCLMLGALLPMSCASENADPPNGSPSQGGSGVIPTGTSGSGSTPIAGSPGVSGSSNPGAGGTSATMGGSAATTAGTTATGSASTGGAAGGNSGGVPSGGSTSGGSANNGGMSSSAADPTCSTGVAKNNVCCAAACGTCGGTGCGDKPGGSTACCNMPILTSGVSCNTSGPPCIIGGDGTGGTNGGTGGTSTGTGGKPSTGGSGSTGGDPCSAAGLVWKSGNKTNFESYPDPGSEECIEYNGCTWAGEFAFCDGKKPESWVKTQNIAAVFPQTGLEKHDICIKQGNKTMVVTVLDTCGDSDCDGCCTENKGNADRLIDLEKYTNQRWGLDDGKIQYADLGVNGNACK